MYYTYVYVYEYIFAEVVSLYGFYLRLAPYFTLPQGYLNPPPSPVPGVAPKKCGPPAGD